MTSLSITLIVIISVLAFLFIVSLSINIFMSFKFFKKNKNNKIKQINDMPTANKEEINLLPTIHIDQSTNQAGNLSPTISNTNMQLSTNIRNVNNSNYLENQYKVEESNLLDFNKNTGNDFSIINSNNSSLHVKRNVNYKPEQSNKPVTKGKINFNIE